MATKGPPTSMPLLHYAQKASSNFSHYAHPRLTPRSQMNKRKQVSQVPAVATAMPSPHGNRPVRSAKQAQRAPGCVDSSTLLFDSEDEGTDDAKSESEYDSEDEAKDENDYGTQHIAKKPRLGGKLLAQAKKEVTPPPPDSSCLAYYPALYEAVQRWNRLLGLPPPQSMSDTPGNKMHEVDAPKPQVAKAFKAKAFKAKDFEAQDFRNFKGSVSDDFRVVRNQSVINRNASYDAKRAGFEQLPGEIRNKIYALVFKKKAPIDFLNRSGFAHSAAFLRVNKVVYSEARVFLYSQNRFVFGHNYSKTGAYYEPTWKELGWRHVRRFFTDIGPENTSLIKDVGMRFHDASPSGNPETTVDERRYTYNEDLLWILDHLGKNGKILKLILSFGGRRSVMMSARDRDFLIALKGVKTDKLDVGDPDPDGHDDQLWIDHSKIDPTAKILIKVMMVRPLPLEELDPRLEF